MEALAHTYTEFKPRPLEDHVVDFTDAVIVVDDDQDDRDTVGRTFAEINPGQKLRFFTNGGEFRKHVQNQNVIWHANQSLGAPRLIILDLQMPVLDGLGTLQDIRSHPLWRDVPVIIVSGTKDDFRIRKAYDMGANAFLSKPFNLFDLVQAIRGSYNFSPTTL